MFLDKVNCVFFVDGGSEMAFYFLYCQKSIAKVAMLIKMRIF